MERTSDSDIRLEYLQHDALSRSYQDPSFWGKSRDAEVKWKIEVSVMCADRGWSCYETSIVSASVLPLPNCAHFRHLSSR